MRADMRAAHRASYECVNQLMCRMRRACAERRVYTQHSDKHSAGSRSPSSQVRWLSPARVAASRLALATCAGAVITPSAESIASAASGRPAAAHPMPSRPAAGEAPPLAGRRPVARGAALQPARRGAALRSAVQSLAQASARKEAVQEPARGPVRRSAVPREAAPPMQRPLAAAEPSPPQRRGGASPHDSGLAHRRCLRRRPRAAQPPCA
mmetsp:Transcript_47567/g.150793  ORF Transcript_47567/g.150793 Transcript_47567/m.150793 type:complete len:210 (+) Transcript_47567:46-675(+)